MQARSFKVSGTSETNSSTQQRTSRAKNTVSTLRNFARRSQSPVWSTTNSTPPKLKVSQSCDPDSCARIHSLLAAERFELIAVAGERAASGQVGMVPVHVQLQRGPERAVKDRQR